MPGWLNRPLGSQGWLGGMLVLLLLVAAGIPGAGSATAFWSSTGTGVASALTGTLAAPTGVTVAATSGPSVSVSWTASSGTPNPTGYYVTRTTGGTTVAACASSPTTLLTGTSCTDTGVAAGSYTYSVTAVYRTWTAVSSPSGTVVVASPTKLAFGVQPSTTVAGVAISPAVTVALQNAAGGAAAVAGVSVSLAIGTNPAPGGTLSGSVTAVTDSNGIATFSGLSITRANPGYTLIATSSGLTQATSASFTITPAAATQLMFTTNPVAVTASATTNSSTITVQRQDAFGNPVTAGTTFVALSSSATTGRFVPTAGGTPITSLSIAAGSNTASFLYGDTKVGSPVITASSSGLTPISQTETVTIGTVILSFTQQPTTVRAGQVISPTVTVSAVDALGNLYTGAVSLTVSTVPALSSGALYLNGTPTSPVLVTTNASGVATFAGISINGGLLPIGNGFRLTATAAGSSVTSNAFNVTL